VNRWIVPGVLGFFLGVLSLSANVGREVAVETGGARGPLLMSGLGPSEAVWALPKEEVSDDRSDFYFRRIESSESRVSLPLRSLGAMSVALRMDTTVRTRVDLLRENTSLGESFVAPGPWAETMIASSIDPAPVDFTLRFEDAPLVGRSDPENFRRYADRLVIRSEGGFDLPWGSRIAGGIAVAFVVLLIRAAVSGAAAGLAGLTLAALLFWLSLREPVALALALPRLLGFVVAAAALIALLGRFLRVSSRNGAALALLGSAMTFAYGFWSFLPNHSPADLDIHIWRTVDLANVPRSLEAWLRYGSHYPTPSQIRGEATAALGEGPAIPYSPLPYVIFYAAHTAGLDLHWSMNAIQAVGLALLLPLIFALARAASDEQGGLLAAALMALDLATVHHLGRAHSPAVLGGALGLGCLLAFGLSLDHIREPGRWRLPAALLGLGALGYSSTPLFYALFGLCFLGLALLKPGSRDFARPAALALGAGGALALALFYGHYLPGLLSGGGNTALLSDPFPGRTFFIFHNESRQSLRLWRLGLFIPFLAALPALFMIAVRGPAALRLFLLSWAGAWAGIMVLKEPWAFPVLLRWAKEDFYAAPALALSVAIAIARLESRPARLGLTALSLAVAALLRFRDYGFHADSLRFLR
jgi:hypothetical protein